MGSGSAVFGGIGSGCTIFVRSATTKTCHAFGINNQKFGYINAISDEKKKPRYTIAILKSLSLDVSLVIQC